MPYGITQCYLSPGSGDFPRLYSQPKLVLDLATPEGCKVELKLYRTRTYKAVRYGTCYRKDHAFLPATKHEPYLPLFNCFPAAEYHRLAGTHSAYPRRGGQAKLIRKSNVIQTVQNSAFKTASCFLQLNVGPTTCVTSATFRWQLCSVLSQYVNYVYRFYVTWLNTQKREFTDSSQQITQYTIHTGLGRPYMVLPFCE